MTDMIVCLICWAEELSPSLLGLDNNLVGGNPKLISKRRGHQHHVLSVILWSRHAIVLLSKGDVSISAIRIQYVFRENTLGLLTKNLGRLR